MKKTILYLIAVFFLLSFSAPVLAATAPKKAVTPVKKAVVSPTKVVKQPVAKPVKKTVVVPAKKPAATSKSVTIAKAKPKVVTKIGISGEIDYINKIFTLNVKGEVFTVNAQKAKVYVPVIARAVSIDNLTEEMELKVWGIVDNEKKIIEATQIRMIK